MLNRLSVSGPVTKAKNIKADTPKILRPTHFSGHIKVPGQILFGAFSRVLKRIFLCLSHQTHLLKNVIEDFPWTSIMEEFIWSKVAKHINEEEFEKLTLEEKQVQCTNLYYFICEQISRMNPELGLENAQFDQGESHMTVPN
jgi:hypothetical protein